MGIGLVDGPATLGKQDMVQSVNMATTPIVTPELAEGDLAPLLPTGEDVRTR